MKSHNMIVWKKRPVLDGYEVFKGVISVKVETEAPATFLVNQLNEGDKLRTMCRRAAVELEENWAAHCDDDGYGPVNLLNRLKGEMPPDYYNAY